MFLWNFTLMVFLLRIFRQESLWCAAIVPVIFTPLLLALFSLFSTVNFCCIFSCAMASSSWSSRSFRSPLASLAPVYFLFWCSRSFFVMAVLLENLLNYHLLCLCLLLTTIWFSVVVIFGHLLFVVLVVIITIYYFLMVLQIFSRLVPFLANHR